MVYLTFYDPSTEGRFLSHSTDSGFCNLREVVDLCGKAKILLSNLAVYRGGVAFSLEVLN